MSDADCARKGTSAASWTSLPRPQLIPGVTQAEHPDPAVYVSEIELVSIGRQHSGDVAQLTF